MREPLAYLNGEFVPFSAARLPVSDMGVVHGATVTEMARTFGQRCFRLDRHVDRLCDSLRAVGFQIAETPAEIAGISERLIAENAALLPAGHELGLIQFVTAGTNLTYVGAAGRATSRKPTVCIHTFPLPFELWAEKYTAGQALVIPAARHVPPAALDPKIKSRSRLHWYLADEQARRIDPQAVALLLDVEGNLTETSSGNFFVVRDGRIFTPSAKNILEGVSRQVVLELAAELRIELVEQDLQAYHALTANEAFVSSTPYCLLPVTRINQTVIGDGLPGPIYNRLLAAWSGHVGLDIAAQMRSGARERLL